PDATADHVGMAVWAGCGRLAAPVLGRERAGHRLGLGEVVEGARLAGGGHECGAEHHEQWPEAPSRPPRRTTIAHSLPPTRRAYTGTKATVNPNCRQDGVMILGFSHDIAYSESPAASRASAGVM